MIKTYTCIICPKGCDIIIETKGTEIKSIKGAACNRGKEYVAQELADSQSQNF